MFGKNQREQDLVKKVERLKMELGVTNKKLHTEIIESKKALDEKDAELLKTTRKLKDADERLALTQMALDKSVEKIVALEIEVNWHRRAMDLMQDDLNLCEDALDTLRQASFLGTPSAYKMKAEEEKTAEEMARLSKEASARLLIKVREELGQSILEEEHRRRMNDVER